MVCIKQGLTVALLLEAGAAAAQQVRSVLLRGVRAQGLRNLSPVIR